MFCFQVNVFFWHTGKSSGKCSILRLTARALSELAGLEVALSLA